MRKISLAPGELHSDVEGDIEAVDGTLRITAVRVRYHLPIKRAEEQTAKRVLELHPAGCPAHQTVEGKVQFDIQASFTYRD